MIVNQTVYDSKNLFDMKRLLRDAMALPDEGKVLLLNINEVWKKYA